MPNYEYVCPQCSETFYRYLPFSESATKNFCPECPNRPELSKVLGVNFHRSFSGGYSFSTGSYVSNDRDHRDQLKVASEQASLRTGIPHNFVPIDMRDPAQTGQTEEGLDATLAQRTADGKREAKKWL